MKRTGLLLVAMFTVLVSTTSVSFGFNGKTNDSTQMAVIAHTDNLRFDLIFASNNASINNVRIEDANGNTVFVDYFKERQEMRRMYNFRHLPYGNYTFVVDVNGKRETLKVQYSANSSKVLNNRTLAAN